MTDKILVVQLGKTGLSFVRHFSRLGCEVLVVDERDEPPGARMLHREYPQVELRKVASYGDISDLIEQSDTVAASPGVAPHRLPAGTRAVGDLCCFLGSYMARWPRQDRRPSLVVITGTNGKSTVASLVAGMLNSGGDKADVAGNIGIPLLDAMRKWEQNAWPRFIVAELSSFQLARCERPLGADIACLLNITPDHLDWHGSKEDYLLSKAKVFSGAAIGLFGEADAETPALCSGAKEAHPYNDETRWRFDGEKIAYAKDPSLQVDAARLQESGIVPMSACAALAIAGHATQWQDCEKHLAWLSSAHGLPHRLELVSLVDGIKYVNDSKATNEAASIIALDAINDKCVLVAGGVDKGQDFRLLAQKAKNKVAAAVLIGSDCDCLARALKGADIPIQKSGSLKEAVYLAADKAGRLGTHTVLFSPACSSFDMFGDYAERGEAFKNTVTMLGNREYASA